MTDVRVRLMEPADVDEAFVARWDGLAARALEPNPYFEPPMLGAALAHLADDPSIRLVVAEAADELRFLAPVHRTSRYRRVPVRTLRTWSHAHNFLGAPLVAPTSPVSTWSAVLHFLRDAASAAWFCLEEVRAEGPVVRALQEACGRHGTTLTTLASTSRATLDRELPADYVATRLSASRRKTLRRHRRRLSDALGAPVEVDDLALASETELLAAVEHFLELEAAGWKGEDGGAMDVRPGHAAFFRAFCREAARRGRLEMLRLGANGTAVAYTCNVTAQDHGFGFKVAYDPAYARHSPGLLLQVEELQSMVDRGDRVRFDACASPDGDLPNMLFADRLALATLAVPLNRLSGPLAARVVPALLTARERVRDRRPTRTAGGAS
ncbi:GNAT family N-acetyltransferase [Nocardioidaceae bacterium]|nr:GNAT family N-acetyltransferase [Nocardioidaceae bacterium]